MKEIRILQRLSPPVHIESQEVIDALKIGLLKQGYVVADEDIQWAWERVNLFHPLSPWSIFPKDITPWHINMCTNCLSYRSSFDLDVLNSAMSTGSTELEYPETRQITIDV
jgi:hypothetical protein